MYLIDHTDNIWQQKVRRVNGALTYSKELVEYQIPLWREVLGPEDIISTCPKFCDTEITGSYKTAVQYLHSYPYTNPIERTRFIRTNLPFKAERVIFVSAYADFVQKLNTHNLKTVFCPMAIDGKALQQYKRPKNKPGRIIYFGNVIQNKVRLFNILKKECLRLGLGFDYISNGRLNAQKELTREEIFELVSTYDYGIAVGRCAQELMALGVKTLIAGHKFGGLITNEDEYKLQLNTNMNGRITTSGRSIPDSINNLDKSILRYNDISEVNHALTI